MDKQINLRAVAAGGVVLRWVGKKLPTAPSPPKKKIHKTHMTAVAPTAAELKLWNGLRRSGTKRASQVLVFPEVDDTYSIVVHVPNFLSPTQCAAVYRELSNIDDELPEDEGGWIPKKGFMKTANTVLRLNRWHHTDGLSYKFSGKVHRSQPMTPHVERLQKFLNNKLAGPVKREAKWLSPPPSDDQESSVPSVPSVVWSPLNSVLINKYRGAADSIALHSDDEPEFGPQPTIASLTLGWGRSFHLKRMTEKVRAEAWSGKKSKARGRVRDFVPDPEYKSESYSFDLREGDLLLMMGSTQEFWLHSVNKATPAEIAAREAEVDSDSDVGSGSNSDSSSSSGSDHEDETKHSDRRGRRDQRGPRVVRRPKIRYNLTFRPFNTRPDWPAHVRVLPKAAPAKRKPKAKTKAKTKAKAKHQADRRSRSRSRSTSRSR